MPVFRASGYRLAPYLPSLLEIQLRDFRDFLTYGIGQCLSAINPIRVRGENTRLVFYPNHYLITKPVITVREAVLKQLTYDCSLYVLSHVFYGNNPIEPPTWILLGNFPLMTFNGHFVINGSSRVLVSQIVRRPGIYFKETLQGTGAEETRVIFADVICDRGAWVRIQRDKKGKLWACLKNTPKIHLDDFIQAFRAVETNRFKRNSEDLDAFNRIGKRLNLTDSDVDDFLFSRFKKPKAYNLGPAGREQLNKKLDVQEKSFQLTANDLERTRDYLLELAKYNRGTDDIDNLGNRQVRTAGELFSAQFYIGLTRLEKSVRQKIARLKKPEPARTILANIKPLNQAFREFFNPTNPLAQFLDQVNPLSDITHKRRITATGPGGVNRENASLDMRSIHPTHYGRICPIETPEGRNAGLVNSLTVYGRVNKLGYIETPYYRVFNGQIQKSDGIRFFSTPAEQSNAFKLAPPDLWRDQSDVLPNNLVPVRIATEFQEDFVRRERADVDYIGLGPAQQMSIATSLIPFLEHDDANRALMGSNMQRQTVPLIQPERPIISTGLEGLVIGESGHIIQASQSGIISYVSGSSVQMETLFEAPSHQTHKPLHLQSTCPGFVPMQLATYQSPHAELLLNGRTTIEKSSAGRWIQQMHKKWYEDPIPCEAHTKPGLASPLPRTDFAPSEHIQKKSYSLHTYDRSNQETGLTHRPAVEEGEWVQKGDLIADCAASMLGQLSLGRNLLIAYTPWEGFNFEDAVVISERLVFDELYTTIHIDRHETEVQDGFGEYEIISKKLLPYVLPAEFEFWNTYYNRKLDENGIIKVGEWVEPFDPIVAKFAPFQRLYVSPYQRLALDILEVLPPSIKDVSVRLPYAVRGRVVNTQIIHKKALAQVVLDELRRVEEIHRAYDPSLPPMEMPALLPSKVRVFLAEKRRIQVGDKMAGRHGNKGIISCILPRQDMPYLSDGTAVDMVLNPLGVPSRMNVGQVFECLLGLAGSYLGQNFRVTPFDEMFGPEASRGLVYLKLYQARLKTKKKWLFQPNFPGKMPIFDGRTGECFDQFVTVGSAYMLKLIHLVEHKIHARSDGPYALITQQPVSGRAKNGGQRLGEMEVWALEAFGAAYTLQEMLSTKSDDIDNRDDIYASVLLKRHFVKLQPDKDPDEYLVPLILEPMKKPPFRLGSSEAFRILLRELQSLCLNVGVYGFQRPIDDISKDVIPKSKDVIPKSEDVIPIVKESEHVSISIRRRTNEYVRAVIGTDVINLTPNDNKSLRALLDNIKAINDKEALRSLRDEIKAIKKIKPAPLEPLAPLHRTIPEVIAKTLGPMDKETRRLYLEAARLHLLGPVSDFSPAKREQIKLFELESYKREIKEAAVSKKVISKKVRENGKPEPYPISKKDEE